MNEIEWNPVEELDFNRKVLLLFKKNARELPVIIQGYKADRADRMSRTTGKSKEHWNKLGIGIEYHDYAGRLIKKELGKTAGQILGWCLIPKNVLPENKG